MRTEEKFAQRFEELKRYTNMHKKAVWFVPSDDDYHLSVIKPNASELPYGTCANLYDEKLDIKDSVSSSQTLGGN